MTKSKQELTIVTQAMEWAYDKVLDGAGRLGTAEEMAEEYLSKSKGDRLEAANSLIRWQNSKAGASGFATSLGGFATLPVTIPADMASMLYIQLKMIAAMAHMGGYDVRSDKVRTLAFACLAGKSATDVIRSAGVQVTQNLAKSFLEKHLQLTVLQKIKQLIGIKVAESAGKIFAVQLLKLVPVMGGVAGAGFNVFLNHQIGKIARNTFIGQNEENIVKAIPSFTDGF